MKLCGIKTSKPKGKDEYVPKDRKCFSTWLET